MEDPEVSCMSTRDSRCKTPGSYCAHEIFLLSWNALRIVRGRLLKCIQKRERPFVVLGDRRTAFSRWLVDSSLGTRQIPAESTVD